MSVPDYSFYFLNHYTVIYFNSSRILITDSCVLLTKSHYPIDKIVFFTLAALTRPIDLYSGNQHV